MEVTPNIPLIWAKQIRDAGMVKNQALKILKESRINAEVAQETLSKPSTQPAQANTEQAPRKLDIV
jgi:hypothetical protein